MVAGCSSRSSSSSASAQALVGQMAPDFTINDVKGNPFKLSEHRGKPVFLDFWATWCPPCRISTPEVRKLNADYASKGITIVGISLDDRVDKVTDFASENDVSHTQLFCNACGVDDEYGVRGIPTFVAIDKEGRISKVWVGFNPTTAGEWRAEMDRLLTL
jgi:peroxiredoxin